MLVLSSCLSFYELYILFVIMRYCIFICDTSYMLWCKSMSHEACKRYYMLCNFRISYTVFMLAIWLLYMSCFITVLQPVCMSCHICASLYYILHIKHFACQTFYHITCNTFYMTALEHTNMPLVLHHLRHVCLSFTLQSNNAFSEKQWFSNPVAACCRQLQWLSGVHLFQGCYFSRNFAPERQSDGQRIHIVPRRTKA